MLKKIISLLFCRVTKLWPRKAQLPCMVWLAKYRTRVWLTTSSLISSVKCTKLKAILARLCLYVTVIFEAWLCFENKLWFWERAVILDGVFSVCVIMPLQKFSTIHYMSYMYCLSYMLHVDEWLKPGKSKWMYFIHSRVFTYNEWCWYEGTMLSFEKARQHNSLPHFYYVAGSAWKIPICLSNCQICISFRSIPGYSTYRLEFEHR